MELPVWKVSSPHESDHALHMVHFYFGVTLKFPLESFELPVESVITTLEFPLESFELQVLENVVTS